MIGVVVAAAVVFVVVLAFSLKLTLRRRLAVTTVLNALQGFFPPFTSSVSFGLIWTLALAPVALLQSRQQLRQRVVILVAGVLVSEIVAGIWSPDLSIWRIRLLETLAFGIALILAFELKARGHSAMKLVLTASTPWVLGQAISVVLFRLFPALEGMYLHSWAAGFLVGSSATDLYSGGFNNVLDPTKSGGFLFINANVASMLAGMYLMAYLWAWLTSRSTLSGVMAICMGVSILFTGSKTGIVLLAGLGLLVGFSFLLTRSRRPWSFLAVLLAILLVGGFGGANFLRQDSSGLGAQTDATWGIRMKLWTVAARFFQQDPILGLGFGGWTARLKPLVKTVGLDRIYPPHNFIIAMWGESGMITVAVVLVILGYLLVGGVQRIRSSETGREAIASAAILAIVVWSTLHGMADNTTFFGTIETAALFAAAVTMISRTATQATDYIDWLRVARLRKAAPVANSWQQK
jgi:O-antigen ligase